MIVYRVEKDKVGPYRNDYRTDKMSKMIDSHNWGPDRRRPPQLESGINRSPYEGEVCGFESRQALRVWFYGFMSELDRAGFRIHTYEVEEPTIGRSQLLFFLNEAKLLSTSQVR